MLDLRMTGNITRAVAVIDIIISLAGAGGFAYVFFAAVVELESEWIWHFENGVEMREKKPIYIFVDFMGAGLVSAIFFGFIFELASAILMLKATLSAEKIAAKKNFAFVCTAVWVVITILVLICGLIKIKYIEVTGELHILGAVFHVFMCVAVVPFLIELKRQSGAQATVSPGAQGEQGMYSGGPGQYPPYPQQQGQEGMYSQQGMYAGGPPGQYQNLPYPQQQGQQGMYTGGPPGQYQNSPYPQPQQGQQGMYPPYQGQGQGYPPYNNNPTITTNPQPGSYPPPGPGVGQPVTPALQKN